MTVPLQSVPYSVAVTPAAAIVPHEVLRDGIVDIVREHLEAHPKLTVIPGAAVAVAVGRLAPVCIVTGRLHRDRDDPITPETLFRACSITKAITAAACLRLVDRGVLSLDEPILERIARPILTATQLNGADPREITLRRVLSHTAGFNVHSYDFLNDHEPMPTATALMGGVMGPWGLLTITEPPGSHWSYSGGGYTLLRVLIESITGRDAAAVIREEVLEPAGMDSSSFRADGTKRPQLATAHAADGTPIDYRELPDVTASGLFTTAPDLARFWMACMPGDSWAGERPALLSRELAAQATRDQRTNEVGRPWGLGFQLDTHAGSPIFRHAGCRPGWWGHVEGHPQARVALVTLCNGQQGDTLFDMLIGKVRRHIARTAAAHDDPGAARAPQSASS